MAVTFVITGTVVEIRHTKSATQHIFATPPAQSVDSVTSSAATPLSAPPPSSTRQPDLCDPTHLSVTGNSQGESGIAAVEIDLTNLRPTPCQLPQGWRLAILYHGVPPTRVPATTERLPPPLTAPPNETIRTRWSFSNFCGPAAPVGFGIDLGSTNLAVATNAAQGFAFSPRCDDPSSPAKVSYVGS
ncbi:MAG: hypothetical protein NVS3B21_10960 [Acidimicrobiales bacterium]